MCRNLLPKKITAGTVLINARFLLLKTRSLSAGGGEEVEEEIRKTESGEKRKREKVGKRKTGQRRGIWKNLESMKWFYLQTRGWRGKTRRCIGIKSGESQQRFTILLFVVVFMCECAVVARTLAIPPVSRFSRFKSTLSPT